MGRSCGMSGREGAGLAGLVASKPWNDPLYKAREKDDLDMRVRRVYGDRAVDEWKRTLKAGRLWRG